MKILLLEDELMLQTSIQEYLEQLKHDIYSFNDGLKAKDSLINNKYDLLILDINIPNFTGLEFCEYIKQNNINTPCIFISALIDIDTITYAFNLGAIDYIKKPFHLKELAIKIELLSNTIDNKKLNHIILNNHYSYNKVKKELLYNNENQNLTKKQIEIIDFLCFNLNNIVSYEMLREYVWNYSYVSDGTIRSEISRLRKTLKDDFIINQKGLGYKINTFNIKI